MELYNKYRPHSLDEFVGQDPIIRLLRARLDKNAIAGAYLASGPSGTGKSSLASALCGELSIASMDYHEILSQNCSVDDVRALRYDLLIAPWQSGSPRLWLIDEAHTLSPASRSAFLSLLERLPEKRIILFTTTKPRDFDGVWRSRCRELRFRKIPDSIMRSHLLFICREENASVRVAPIIRLSDGNLRLALQLLEDEILVPGSLDARPEEDFQQVEGIL